MNGWPVQIGAPEGPWKGLLGGQQETRIAGGEDKLAQAHRDYWEQRKASGGKSVAIAPPHPMAQRPLREPRSAELQVLLIETACEGCTFERRYDNDAPGCARIAGCCGSRGPLAFSKWIAAGRPCPHPDGDRWAVFEVNEFKVVGSG